MFSVDSGADGVSKCPRLAAFSSDAIVSSRPKPLEFSTSTSIGFCFARGPCIQCKGIGSGVGTKLVTISVPRWYASDVVGAL